MNFEWNNAKNQTNRAKHGLDFNDAHVVFSSETLTFVDDRIDYGEQRLITLGSLLGRIVIIVHTQRGESIRIISMRKANEREKDQYFKRLKKTRHTE